MKEGMIVDVFEPLIGRVLLLNLAQGANHILDIHMNVMD